MSLFNQKIPSIRCALFNKDDDHGQGIICVNCYQKPLSFTRKLIDRLCQSKKVDTEGIIEILKADKDLGLGLLGQTYDDIYQAGFKSGVRSVTPAPYIDPLNVRIAPPDRHWNAQEYAELVRQIWDQPLGGVIQVPNAR